MNLLTVFGFTMECTKLFIWWGIFSLMCIFFNSDFVVVEVFEVVFDFVEFSWSVKGMTAS